MTYTVNFFPSRINIRSSELRLRGIFFFVIYHKFIGPGHSRLPEDLRLYRRADLRSHSTASKPPELAAPGAYAAGPSSRPPSLGKLARRPGESGITHSQHGCKGSRNPGDSGKDRPASPGWPPVGPIQKYLSAAPVDVSTANISFRVLAFGAVARIGCVCIAVLSVSGSLELRRRRIKSASQSWIWQSTFGRF